jgi:serine/threonine protein kinase
MTPDDIRLTAPWEANRPGRASPALAALLIGAEVVPGYPLVSRLGRGGFGEVWKATGPGDVPVALKFLPCAEQSAAVEVRSLDFMKYIVHPHLVTTFGIWHRDDLLIIGMELADETLLDRLRRANHEGQAGVPAEELLEYMREAAKGIDFLNEPRHSVGGATGVSITHRDIKPPNLLLVGGGVKVADFGLARAVERSVTTKTGGLTPAYAAPEFFEGQVQRQSDQYSLAVSYCQLRSNRLPFEGHPLQVLAGHLHGTPDVGFLPQGEREVVARALARQANDRWPNCRVFVQQLSECSGPGRKAPLVEREVWVDTTPMLRAAGGLCALPYTSSMPMWVFLADVFLLIRTVVEPYTYGKKWVLREPSTGRVFDVGSPWARSTGVNQDARRLSAVGIRPGMRLEVVPLLG